VSATGSINYNSGTGVFSYTAPTVLSAFTNDVGFLTSATILNAISVVSTPSEALTYNSANGVFTFTQAVNSVNGLTGTVTLTSTNIAEGTNKYATTGNVQTALAGGGVSNSMLANSTLTVNGSTLTLGAASTITAAAGTLTGTTLNATVVASSLTTVGTLTALAVGGAIASASNLGAINYGTLGYTDTNMFASFQNSVNSANQVVIQNTNAGASASARLRVANNQSTTSTFFGALGMNSSAFTGTGSLRSANNVTLTSTSADLAIGTTTANAIRFVVNSGATDAMTISTASNVGVGVAPSYKLDVAGDVNFTGALRTSGNAGTSGFVLQSKGAAAPQWVDIAQSLPNITQLDSWSATINGGTTVYTPTNNGSAVSITYPIQVLMFKNGVYQQPWLNNSRPVWNTFTKYGDYTVTAGQIVFTSPPQYGDFISATVMVGNVSNPVYGSYPFNATDIATGT
jgi:hypothetical protein